MAFRRRRSFKRGRVRRRFGGKRRVMRRRGMRPLRIGFRM